MSGSTLEITLPYADVTEFVARFRMVTHEGIELPSPFARKVGESVRFVVRLLDRTLVLEGTGVVADVSDNGRGSNPDARYDLAIAFTDKTATTDVMIERLVLAQEFDTTEPTGMRKAPPDKPRASAPPAPAPRPAPPRAAAGPLGRAAPPLVKERLHDGDLLEEIDEEDMLTPPPRVLPRAPEPPARPPRPSAPPPLPARPSARSPAEARRGVEPPPSSPPRPSSPPERPSAPPARPFGTAGAARPSAPPPARSSMTPLPPAPVAPRAPAPTPAPAAPRTAPPRKRTSPGTGGGAVPPDLRVKTEVDRIPSFDTQTDVRREPAAAAPAGAKMPLPTRAAPAPRTLTGATIPLPGTAPPRRRTGQRKAVEAPPPAEDPPLRAPPRRKTLQGAAVADRTVETPAPPRRKTGTGRAVDGPAPPRRKTGQRRAIDPNDVTQRTSTAGILDEDTDPAPVRPRGGK